MRKQNATGENLKIEFVRVIRASKQRVFDAWSRPEMIRQWFGSPDKKVVEIEANAKVDGTYRIKMDKPCEEGAALLGMDPTQSAQVKGRYVTVDPYDLLVFTWTGSWDESEESLVTIALKEVAGGTEMKMTHERFLTEASRAAHEGGWNYALPNFEAFVLSSSN
jgi:uncharacterized protein YndB with AHSA1/START domain